MKPLIHYELTLKNFLQHNTGKLSVPALAIGIIICLLAIIKYFRWRAGKRRELNRHFPTDYRATVSQNQTPGQTPIDTTSTVVVSKRFK